MARAITSIRVKSMYESCERTTFYVDVLSDEGFEMTVASHQTGSIYTDGEGLSIEEAREPTHEPMLKTDKDDYRPLVDGKGRRIEAPRLGLEAAENVAIEGRPRLGDPLGAMAVCWIWR